MSAREITNKYCWSDLNQQIHLLAMSFWLSSSVKRIFYNQVRKQNPISLFEICSANTIIRPKCPRFNASKIRLLSTVPGFELSQNYTKTSRKVSRRRPVSFSVGHGIYNSLSLSEHIRPVENKEFDGKLKSSSNLSAKDLLQKLHSSKKLPLYELKEIEQAIVGNFSELELNEKFLAAHLFFSCYFRCPKYLSTLFEYIDNEFDHVINEPSILKLTLFYIYFHGSGPETLLQKIEDHLSGIVMDLSPDEIGLVCLGYFRANRRIFSFDLLDEFAERTLAQLGSFKPNHLINVLKAFRHAGYCKVSFFERLADQLILNDLLNGFSLNQIMHVVMAFASTRIYHPALIHHCLVRALAIVNDRPSIRSKEIGRIIWAVGTLGITESDMTIVETLIDIHSQIEDQGNNEYPESVCDTVMGSIFLGIFPQNLINYLMKDENVELLQGLRGLEKKSQLLLIHNSTHIECPNYKGLRLKKQAVKKFQVSDFQRAIKFELKTRSGLSPIYEQLVKLIGPSKVHCHMILPHFTTADIELHLNSDNCPLNFTPSSVKLDSDDTRTVKFQQSVTEDLLKQLTNPSTGKQTDYRKTNIARRIVIQVAGPNQCSLTEPHVIFGTYRTKLRQLELLGFEVILITSTTARQLNEKLTFDEQKEWILQNIIEKFNININNT
eukprot:XP_014789256.1 PREDICTED: FAST kinase domain-containing protein 5-like [Octopus bimaculoides]